MSTGDGKFVDFASGELETIELIDRKEAMEPTLVRVPTAYPAYFGSHSNFGKIRTYFDGIGNLYP